MAWSKPTPSGRYVLVTDPQGVIQTGVPEVVEPANLDRGAAAASLGAVAAIAGARPARDVSGSPAPTAPARPAGSIRTAAPFEPLDVLAAGLLGAALAMAGRASVLRGRSRSPRPAPGRAITSVEAGPEVS